MSSEIAKANTSVAAKTPSLREMLTGEAFKESINTFFATPKMRDRFLGVALNACVKTPKLFQCSPASFFGALKQLASFGLEPNGRDAHILPYGNTAQLIIDYKGLIQLAMRSPRVSKLDAVEVRRNDLFTIVNGEVEHQILDPFGDRGEVVGYYAVCQFADGVKKYEVMSLAEVEAIRKRSRAATNGPWVTDFGEMAKKTVFKRLSKWLPLSAEAVAAVDFDNAEYEEEKRPQVRRPQAVDMGENCIIDADSIASCEDTAE